MRSTFWDGFRAWHPASHPKGLGNTRRGPRASRRCSSLVCPISSPFAPCDSGTALRNLVLLQRKHATGRRYLCAATDLLTVSARSTVRSTGVTRAAAAPSTASKVKVLSAINGEWWRCNRCVRSGTLHK